MAQQSLKPVGLPRGVASPSWGVDKGGGSCASSTAVGRRLAIVG